MRVLAVEGAPGQWLVGILKPMGAHEIRVVDDGPQVTGVGGAAFLLTASADKAFPEQAAIGRAEMKLANQSWFGERVETCPFVVVIGDRSLVEIEADDIAPAGTRLDRLGGPPGKTAAEIEMVWIVTVKCFSHRMEIGLGEPLSEGREIANYRRIAEARRR